MPTPSLKYVSLLVALSGFCSLVYQMVWFREFRLVFGASTLATSAVLAIFMGGLGLGGFVLGKRADHWPRPFKVYARIELAIAVSAAGSPLLLEAVRQLYFAVGGSSVLGGAATLLRLALAALVLGPCVFFMGGTLPAAAKVVTTNQDKGRSRLAVLYAVNTLGAVAGVVTSTFWLFELLGFRTTLWAAALLNAGIAAAAWAAARRPEAATVQPPVSVDAHAGEDLAPHRAWVLPAAFATGFVFLLSELVWYRLAAPILGGSTYTLGVVLAVALFGIGAGGALYSLRDPERLPTPGQFGVTCSLQALALLVPFAMGDRLALSAYYLNALGQHSFLSLSLGWTLTTVILVLPAALIAGYQFPLMFALKGRGAQRVASDTGKIYAANTLGAIAGALAGGFGLLPVLGSSGAWLFAAGLLSLLGLYLALTHRREPFNTGLSLALIGVTVVLSLSPGPTAVWRHTSIGAGRAELNLTSSNEWLRKAKLERAAVVEAHDGVESSLGFTAFNGLSLLVNGKSDGNTLSDAVTMIFAGLTPALLHTEARSAFVIGLGTGETAGWLAEVPSMKRVEVVEIEPKVLRFAERAAAVNHRVTRHPKVSLRIGDGREALITTPDSYDLIVSEPSNPYRAGISSFYTQEFYELAAQRLNQGGYFAQWVQLYEIHPEAVQTVVQTMRSVFPQVSFWQMTPGDLLLLGSFHPQVVDLNSVRARLTQEPFSTAMRHVLRSYDAEGFLATHLARAEVADLFSRDVSRRNKDDHPVLEYMFARNVGTDLDGSETLELILNLAAEHGLDKPLFKNAPDIDWRKVALLRARPHLVSGYYPSFLPSRQGDAFADEAAFWTHYFAGDFAQAYAQVSKLRVGPDDLFVRYFTLEVRARQVRPDAALEKDLRAFEQRAYRPEATALRLYLSLKTQDTAAVAKLLPVFLDDARLLPWTLSASQALVLEALAEFQAAPDVTRDLVKQLGAEPWAVHKLEAKRLSTLRTLVRTERGGRLLAECANVFEALEPHPSWTESDLTTRARCYREQEHPLAKRAERDLKKFERLALSNTD